MSYDIDDNTGFHIDEVVANTMCGHHKKGHGEPCYTLVPNTASLTYILRGVCGKRIKKAGFVGKISASSLRLSAPGGRNEKRRVRS